MATKMTQTVCRLVKWIAAVVFAFAVMVVVFAIGVELGHRRGYDRGFRECLFDAKETLGLDASPAFWRWHGAAPMSIRQYRGFFFR